MSEINILSLARENVVRLKPYSSARDDFEGAAQVFLDANENPFPDNYNRYPDPHQKRLKQAIAGLKGTTPDRIFLGNGSDEVIDLLLRVFCNPGTDEVVIPAPTYGMYSVSAEVNDIKVIAPTLTPAFDLDTTLIASSITPKTKIIFLCSPNNPSGNLLKTSEIEKLLKVFHGILVIDEAYIDFSGTEGWIRRLNEFKNLVVMQTFSKAWGLAGLRLGMCFCNPDIIGLLNKIKPPYNINAFTQSEVLDRIKTGQTEKKEWVAAILKEREKLNKALSNIRMVKNVFPSDANFLLVEVEDAAGVYQKLISRGIVVRNRSGIILCDNCLRITVGTENENKMLINALKET